MSLRPLLTHPTTRLLAKAILAAVVLGYLVYIIEPAEIARALRQAQWGLVLIAALLLPVNLLLEGLVWKKMLMPVTRGLSQRSLYEALLCGFSLGVFTPARLGEFAGRAFYLEHPDRWETSVTVMMQRLLDMAAGVCIGSVALALVLLRTDWLAGSGWWMLFAAGCTVTITLFALLLLPGSSLALLRRFVSSAAILDRLRLLQRVETGYMAVALGWAALRYGVYVTQFALLAWAFGAAAEAAPVYGAIMLVYLAKFLAPSLTLMDLGLREGFAVFFFAVVGLSEVAAFNASLFVFLLNVAVPAALGLPYLMRMRVDSAESCEPQRESRPAEAG